MSEIPKFKGWAIVELMGHVRMAGHVEEATIAGQGVLKVDVPEAEGDCGKHPAFTQFVSGASLYRLTPTTEEIARSVAKHSRPSAVHSWEQPRPALPASKSDDDAPHPDAAKNPPPDDWLDNPSAVAGCLNCGTLTSCAGARGQPLCRDCGGIDDELPKPGDPA